jgi:hypothetical protein
VQRAKGVVVRTYLKKLFILVIAGGISASLLPEARSAELPSAPVGFEAFEVTHPNADQQAEVEQLRQTLQAKGMETSGIRVYLVPEADGPTTYVTRSPSRFRVRTAGDGVYQTVPRAEAAATNILSPTFRAMDAGGWTLNDHDCFRVSKEWFARWVCWRIDKQDHDSDPSRSFWQYKQDAIGSAKGGWEMKRLWVEGKPAGDSIPMRFDGIPEPKESIPKQDRCKKSTDTVSISIASGKPVAAGYSHSWDHVRCEEYEVKHYDDHAHWAVIWKGAPVDKNQGRNVVFVMPVSTHEGGRPAWEAWSGQHRD